MIRWHYVSGVSRIVVLQTNLSPFPSEEDDEQMSVNVKV